MQLIISFFLTLFTSVLLSQTTINFCTAVDKEQCFFNNTQFITPLDSSKAVLYMLAKNPRGFGTTNLVFKIYKTDKEGNETLMDVTEQPVEPTWDWAWKSYLFSTPAKYNIKIYDNKNELVATKSFELFLPRKE